MGEAKQKADAKKNARPWWQAIGLSIANIVALLTVILWGGCLLLWIIGTELKNNPWKAKQIFWGKLFIFST